MYWTGTSQALHSRSYKLMTRLSVSGIRAAARPVTQLIAPNCLHAYLYARIPHRQWRMEACVPAVAAYCG